MKLSPEKRMVLIILVISNLFAAGGQLFFKYSLLYNHILLLYILGGVILYGVSTAMYLYVLGRTHLSWAFGIGAISYVFAVILAVILLHEIVTPIRWAGVLVITAGAALIGVS